MFRNKDLSLLRAHNSDPALDSDSTLLDAVEPLIPSDGSQKSNESTAKKFSPDESQTKTVSDIYFMVGNNVRIRRRAINTVFKDRNFDNYLRPEIPREELIGAYPKLGLVKLFPNEEDALCYVMMRSSGKNFFDDGNYSQPPIFTVQCPDAENESLSEAPYTIITRSNGINHEVQKTLRYYEVDLQHVSVLSVQMRVNILFLDKKHNYPLFQIEENELDQKNSSQCAIM